MEYKGVQRKGDKQHTKMVDAKTMLLSVYYSSWVFTCWDHLVKFPLVAKCSGYRTIVTSTHVMIGIREKNQFKLSLCLYLVKKSQREELM